ncbi:MAG: cytochrome b [Halioglobus sp.]|nr:cytochrome b [Halioglobus sp.]
MDKDNTPAGYSIPFILVHWVTAIVVLGLFVLGLWMVDLGYYDPWYNRAPNIHRSIGVLITLVVVARMIWRKLSTMPESPKNHKPWERTAARLTHALLYLLLLLMGFSGYFISSAKGQAVDVFNWFSIPAITSSIENLEDASGLIHEIAAYVLITLTIVHASAAIKHHFVERDNTLKRMLGM